MKWNVDLSRNTHILEDSGSHLAKVFLKETGAPRNRFRVKTLISFLYFSATRQKQLERAGRDWEVTVKKFDSLERAEKYIEVKKREVSRFIAQRESA